MNNSVYNTTLVKHEKFRQRLKEERKKKGWNAYALGNRLGYNANTVNNWTKKKGNHFPNEGTLIKLSELFDCDVAYLRGEIDFKKVSEQRISDLTGLSETSAKYLSDNKKNVGTLDKLISHKDFLRLMAAVFQFTHSHNVDINADNNSYDLLPTNKNAKELYKTIVMDIFSNIIESMYNDNVELMNFDHDRELLTNMLHYIQELHGLAETNTEAKHKLLGVIANDLKKFKSNRYDAYFKTAAPETIYNNYETLAQKFEIALE